MHIAVQHIESTRQIKINKAASKARRRILTGYLVLGSTIISIVALNALYAFRDGTL